MSSGVPGLFYAYAKNISDDWSYRYLITFASREVADLWYRTVTDSVAKGNTRFQSVKRVTPQFYTHNPGEGNVPDTITDANVALSLRGNVFFTLINDRDGRILSMNPVINYTDYASGNKFFIRAVNEPGTFWYYDPGTNAVVASTTRRTKFTITIADSTKAAGTTMVGSDAVLISFAGVNVGIINRSDELGSSSNPFPFQLSSFNSDFQIDFGSNPTTAAIGSLGTIARNPSFGEKWEFV